MGLPKTDLGNTMIWRRQVVTPDEMRQLDSWAINKLGIPGIVLMENAARGTATAIAERYPPPKKIAIFVGKGNNGGDGLAVGRWLKAMGYEVDIFAFSMDLRGDALTNLNILRQLQFDIKLIESADTVPWDKGWDIIVDAIFGTGFKGRLPPLFREVIARINAHPAHKVAIDIPSGVDASTGEVTDIAVRADLTCTMGLPKVGFFFPPAIDYVGELKVIDLGVMFEDIADVHIVDHEVITNLLPNRPAWGHKGTFGKVLVIAGSPGFTGAATLASLSALKIGAGLVYLAIPRSLNPILEVKATEVVTIPMPETEDMLLSVDACDRLLNMLDNMNALIIGPGLGRADTLRELILKIIEHNDRVPMLIDADGLNNLRWQDITRIKVPFVVTPHPGELSRLINKKVDEILKASLNLTRELSRETTGVIVLKGAPTIIAHKGKVYINPVYDSALATAGSGDVLSGIIGGLMGMGVNVFDAALLGVYIHGEAGRIAGSKLTPYSVIAGDIMANIHVAVERIIQGGIDGRIIRRGTQ